MAARSRVLLFILVALALAAGLDWGGWRPVSAQDTRSQRRWRLIVQAVPTPEVPEIDDSTMNVIVEILRNRIDAFGVSDVSVQRKGHDQVVVQFRTDRDSQEARSYLQNTAALEFVYIPGLRSDRHPANFRYDWEVKSDSSGSEGVILRDMRNGGKTLDLEKFFSDHGNYQAIVDGKQLITKDVLPSFHPGSAVPEVVLSFNREGTAAFSKFTRSHIGDILVIVFDRKIISAPRISAHIPDGRAVISGGFRDIREASLLATQLRSGAFPVPLKEVEFTQASAISGRTAVLALVCGLLVIGIAAICARAGASRV